MFIMLAIGSVILSIFVASMLQSTPSLSCQETNIRSAIFMFFFLILPLFFLYLQTAITPWTKRLEFARNISKPSSLMYAMQENPVILLCSFIFFLSIDIAFAFSTKCN